MVCSDARVVERKDAGRSWNDRQLPIRLPIKLRIKLRIRFSAIIRKYKSVGDLEKLGINDRQKKALEFIKEKGSISNKEYQNLNQISRYTASRDLKKLVFEDILRIVGKGKREDCE